MSYLSGIKRDTNRLVGALKDELARCQSEADRDQIFSEWSKELWVFLEAHLKQSYLNGLRAAVADPSTAAPKRRFSNWRNRNSDDATRETPNET